MTAMETATRALTSWLRAGGKLELSSSTYSDVLHRLDDAEDDIAGFASATCASSLVEPGTIAGRNGRMVSLWPTSSTTA
jgi:hypothetical protein